MMNLLRKQIYLVCKQPLLVHISHMIRFGQSVSKHKIVLFTEIANDDMMCIYESNDSLVTSRIPSSDMWKN